MDAYGGWCGHPSPYLPLIESNFNNYPKASKMNNPTRMLQTSWRINFYIQPNPNVDEVNNEFWGKKTI